MTDRELMQQALEALEEINRLSIGENAICLPAEIDTAMDALRERLAQPVQEPVAWMYVNTDGECEQIEYETPPDDPSITALYTAPRQWQGLTKEELLELWNSHTEQPFPEWFVDFKRAYAVIAEKLKEKNTCA